MGENDRALLEKLASAAAAAGRTLATAPRRAGLSIKPDGSPVTAADIACEKALIAALAAIMPGLAIVGEESAPADGLLPGDDMIALVDPLDGTRAFADGRADFCINLAILRTGEPWLGVIGAPARGFVYAGMADADAAVAWRAEVRADGSLSAQRTSLRTRRPAFRPPVALVSDRHGDADSEALLARIGATERIRLSSALKFTLLAEGAADIYPRLAPTMVWDTAAGQAILAAAGGEVTDGAGRPLRHAPASPLRNPGFIAVGDPGLVADIRPSETGA